MREVGKRIKLFGVVFNKIQLVKVWSKICYLKLKQKRKWFGREYVFGAGKAYWGKYAFT